MAKKKVSRKELLKGTDEFLSFSARAVNFFTDHTRELKYIGLGIAVVIVGYLSVYTYLIYVDSKGQEAYNLAYDMIVQSESPTGASENGQTPAALFQEVIDEYGMSKAARLALPQLAHIQFVEGNYGEAISHYRKFGKEMSDAVAYEGLNSLALAACYEAEGNYKKAVDVLTPVVDAEGNPFRESAMLSMERVLRLDGQVQKAETLLKEFVKAYPNSPFSPMAKARLRKAT